jgi:hypothetical protein
MDPEAAVGDGRYLPYTNDEHARIAWVLARDAGGAGEAGQLEGALP